MRRGRAKRCASPKRKGANSVTRASGASTHAIAEVSPNAAAFIAKHWPEEGRAERIARAQKAWQHAVEIASTFKKIDMETWKWIAQSKDLEDI